MKKILFETVTFLTYGSIWLADRIFGLPAGVLMACQAFVRKSVATFGYWFMKRIDPTKCKLAEAEAETDPAELKRQDMELKLMQSSYKVRDHAKETGDWTEHHTHAMEAIGNALLLDMGWDEDSVNDHIKSVVESIDGLSFDGWFESED